MNHWHYIALVATAQEWLEDNGFDEITDDFLDESWDIMASDVRESMSRETHDALVTAIVDQGRAQSEG